MKLQTKLTGPAFEGVSGYMFVTVDQPTPRVSFIFDDPRCLRDWYYFVIKENGRGVLQYNKSTELMDSIANISLGEAVLMVREALASSDGRLQTVQCGKTEISK
jgi:hypothetical protein